VRFQKSKQKFEHAIKSNFEWTETEGKALFSSLFGFFCKWIFFFFFEMKKFRKAKKQGQRIDAVIELPPIVAECTAWLTQHGKQCQEIEISSKRKKKQKKFVLLFVCYLFWVLLCAPHQHCWRKGFFEYLLARLIWTT
jgi:hypothetical protein